jgi:WD40 repeat protein
LVASHPNGDRFVTASVAAVEVWDVNTLKPLHRLSELNGRVVAIQFSATGKLFVVAYQNGRIRVYASHQWDLPLLDLQRGDAVVNAVEFMEDESILVIAFESGKIELVNWSNGAAASSLMLTQEPSALRYCASEKELVIGTNTGELIFWAPFSGDHVTTIKSQSGRIHTMQLLPSSATLIIAGRDKVIRFWDVSSRELTTAFPVHFRQVFSVAVSFDEKTLASGSLDGDIRIWRSQ